MHFALVCLGWGEWTEWSNCSVECDNGEEMRTRRPLGDRRCEGSENETRLCSGPPCRCMLQHYLLKISFYVVDIA